MEFFWWSLRYLKTVNPKVIWNNKASIEAVVVSKQNDRTSFGFTYIVFLKWFLEWRQKLVKLKCAPLQRGRARRGPVPCSMYIRGCQLGDTGRDVPLSLCPGTRKFSCPFVQGRRQKQKSHDKLFCHGTSPDKLNFYLSGSQNLVSSRPPLRPGFWQAVLASLVKIWQDFELVPLSLLSLCPEKLHCSVLLETLYWTQAFPKRSHICKFGVPTGSIENILDPLRIIYWSWDFKFAKLRPLWNTKLFDWNILIYVCTTYYYCVLTSFWPQFTTAQEALSRAQWCVFINSRSLRTKEQEAHLRSFK